MKKLILLFFIVLATQKSSLGKNKLLDIKNTSAVTYNFSGGRLGDNLVAYLHAKWISYKYKIPLLYKPFEYSDQLMIHELEKYRYQDYGSLFKKKTVICDDSSKVFNIDPKAKRLYTIPYFSEFNERLTLPKRFLIRPFSVDWQDPEFVQLIRTLIQPRLKDAFIFAKLPTNAISVALHVRKGSSMDNEDGIIDFPLKFPPDHFYLDSIRIINKLCDHNKLYIYLFTDDPNPAALVTKFQAALSDLDNIEFDFRKGDNTCDEHILEDLFFMAKFDCLIRPHSNFSYIASKIGNFKIVISPHHHTLINNTSTIVFFDIVCH